MRATRTALNALSLLVVSRVAARALTKTARELEHGGARRAEGAREHDDARAARDDAGRLRGAQARRRSGVEGVPPAFVIAAATRGGMRAAV